LFFVGTLVPALGFVSVYPFLFSFVADHFQYLASLGAIALAAAFASRWLERRTAQALCLAGLSALAVLTFRQSRLYADGETLYRETIRRNPGCWMAYNNLGGALISRGRTGEARDLIERALELRPDYPEAHNNLGLVLAAEGRAGEAIAQYRSALENGFAAAGVHYNLAMALLARGQPRAAVAHLQRTLELQPEHVQAHNNLGILLAREGRIEDAIAHFRKALEIDPAS